MANGIHFKTLCENHGLPEISFFVQDDKNGTAVMILKTSLDYQINETPRKIWVTGDAIRVVENLKKENRDFVLYVLDDLKREKLWKNYGLHHVKSEVTNSIGKKLELAQGIRGNSVRVFEFQEMESKSELEENSSNAKWSKAEITASVLAYFEMLTMQNKQIPFSKSEINSRLRENELSSRTRASIEFRMQNISCVLDDMGVKYLKGYLPAKNVGINVANEIMSVIDENQLLIEFEETENSDSNIRKLLKKGKIVRPKGNHSPAKKTSSTTVFYRNPHVKGYALQRANEKCEICGKATFVTDDGDIYLEVHHLIPLSNNGSDTPDNVIAACPLCHRELHFGINRVGKTQELIAKIYSLESDLN